LNKKLFGFLLVVALMLLLVVPSAFAASSIKWEGVRTDTMVAGAWDTTMSTINNTFLPMDTSPYAPYYPKPTQYIQLKFRYSGIDLPYYFIQTGAPVTFTKLSTTNNADGSKTDVIQVQISKLTFNNNGSYNYTNPIWIKSYSGSTLVESLNITVKWAL